MGHILKLVGYFFCSNLMGQTAIYLAMPVLKAEGKKIKKKAEGKSHGVHNGSESSFRGLEALFWK